MLKSGKYIILSIVTHVLAVLFLIMINIFLPRDVKPVMVDMRMVHLEEPADNRGETIEKVSIRKTTGRFKKVSDPEEIGKPKKDVPDNEDDIIDTLVAQNTSDTADSSNENIADKSDGKENSDENDMLRKNGSEYGALKDTEVINLSEKDWKRNIRFSYIASIIGRNTKYPAAAEDMEISGTVMLEFCVKNDGSLNGVKVIRSSGYDILDNDAIKTVQVSAPFPSPGVNIKITFPMEYVLNTID